MNISQCQAYAKSVGFDSVEFKLVGPTGELKCKWLDAHFGFFEIEGKEGFYRVQEFLFIDDIHCELI